MSLLSHTCKGARNDADIILTVLFMLAVRDDSNRQHQSYWTNLEAINESREIEEQETSRTEGPSPKETGKKPTAAVLPRCRGESLTMT